MLDAGLPEQVPDARAHLDRTVELPSELADVADALRERRDLADRQLPHRHVRERFVREVGVGDGREDLARARAPQPEAEPVIGHVRDRHALVVPELPPEPREVVHARTTAGHDHERLLVGAGDGQVATDPAGRREHRRVDHRAGTAVDPVRADPLEEREGVRSLDVELHVRGQVEERRALARREVLCADGRRPVLRGPAGARFPRGSAQNLVRVEPLRALPPCAGEELGAELYVPLMERG